MITFEHMGGTGINGVYSVKRDGAHIATIRRTHSRTSWGIYSHYGRALWRGTNVEHAKRAAHEVAYPSKAEIYETICGEVERNRRLVLEEIHAHDFARLTREMVAGSNSARIALEELVVEIERTATDRTATSNPHELRNYTSHHVTVYPDAPEGGN